MIQNRGNCLSSFVLSSYLLVTNCKHHLGQVLKMLKPSLFEVDFYWLVTRPLSARYLPTLARFKNLTYDLSQSPMTFLINCRLWYIWHFLKLFLGFKNAQPGKRGHYHRGANQLANCSKLT